MSLTLISEPYLWGWAQNRNRYRFSCNSTKTSGARCTVSWLLKQRGSNGQHLVVEIDGTPYTWDFVAADVANPWSVGSLSDMAAKITGNYYVAQLFTTTSSVTSGVYTVTLTGKEKGKHDVRLYYTDSDGEEIDATAAALTYYETASSASGADSEQLANYALAVSLEVIGNDCNSLKSYKSDPLYFQPGTDGSAEVPLEMLRGYLPQPDLPTYGETAGGRLLTNAFIKYRIRYGEVYGDTPRMQTASYSSWRYALCGEVVDYYHRLNLPDWQDVAPSEQLSSVSSTGNTYLRMIGDDHGVTTDVRADQPEYLYGLYYQASAAVNANFALQLSVKLYDKEGTETSIAVNFNVKNGNVYRLSVGPAAVGAADSAYYKVLIKEAGGADGWERTYRVLPALYGGHWLLLQDKYGLLRSVAAASVKVTHDVTSEEMTIAGRHYSDKQSHGEKYTVVTEAMRRDEARRVAQSLAKEYHYYYSGGAWLRISVEADSLETWNEKNDMATLTFEFRFIENQTENEARSTARSVSNQEAVTTNITDDAGNFVSFGTQILISNNIIHNA